MKHTTLVYSLRGEAAQSAELQPGNTTIGRQPTNGLVLDTPGVAPFHARILVLEDSCWVIDLGSDEGTFLNHIRLEPQARQRFRQGDRLRIGPFDLRIRPDQQTIATTAVLPPEVLSRLPPSLWRTVTRLSGNHRPKQNGAGTETADGPSRYLAYLPPCYHSDPFFGRFLNIFEAILEPIEQMIDQLDCYTDPWLAPESMLPWLATWLALSLDERWPLEQRRALIASGAELYRWRGTRRGLRQYLQIYTGVTPQIIEWHQPEGEAERLPPHSFLVVIETPAPDTLDRTQIEAIIQAEKPAHAGYRLAVRPA
ncbi:MAG TPA: phage tail protein I [Roseiflexaceae bacterium]|nr:phage tail protein I [Roseiflexaceae bacterium]